MRISLAISTSTAMNNPSPFEKSLRNSFPVPREEIATRGEQGLISFSGLMLQAFMTRLFAMMRRPGIWESHYLLVHDEPPGPRSMEKAAGTKSIVLFDLPQDAFPVDLNVGLFPSTDAPIETLKEVEITPFEATPSSPLHDDATEIVVEAPSIAEIGFITALALSLLGFMTSIPGQNCAADDPLVTLILDHSNGIELNSLTFRDRFQVMMAVWTIYPGASSSVSNSKAFYCCALKTTQLSTLLFTQHYGL